MASALSLQKELQDAWRGPCNRAKTASHPEQADCLIPGFSMKYVIQLKFLCKVEFRITNCCWFLEMVMIERQETQFQIPTPKQSFNLVVHPNSLNSLLIINGYFCRLLVLSPERNLFTVATQQKDLQLWRAQHNTSTSITLGSYVPLEISFYCNNTEQMFPKLTLESPFSSKQLWDRAPSKQGYELANGVNT